MKSLRPSLLHYLPSFQVKFTSAAILPAVPAHPGKHSRHSFATSRIDLYGHNVCVDVREQRGRLPPDVNFTQKRGAVVILKSGERQRGIVILTIKGKDLRIFVVITKNLIFF